MADSNIPKPTLSRMPHSLLGQSLKQAQLPKAVDRNLVLNRFLSGMPAVGKQPGRHIQESDNMDDSLPKEPVQIRRHTARKRAPKRLDVNTTMIQMPLTLSPDPDPEPSGNLSGDAHSMEGLAQRLSGFQRSYSIDFSISPLTPGTFFHETTFIGSGEFKRSLEVGKRDLDKGAGLLEMQIGNQFFSWGSWNDSVSSNIGIAFETMIQEIELSDHAPTDTNTQLGCGRTIYRRLVKYVTETLAFVDPIDRVGFVTRSQGLVSRINDALEAMVSTIPWGTERLTEIASYNLVFANFTYQVACHELVSDSIAGEVLESLKSVSERLLAFILNSSGESDLRKFTRGNELESQREKGIRDGCTMVEAFVVLRHVLRSADRLQGYFESLIVEALLPAGDLNDTMDIKSLENGWGRLFAILPLCEIDNLGIARVGSRFSESHDNWTAVKRLMVPVLDSYQPNSSTPISYNNYCRVLFHRCFHLIEGWGWRDCKMILDVLYDFYAKNTLYNLKQEDNYSSPSFLDDLDSNPSLEVLPGDPCFHIFLKIIARGLRSLSKKYDKKKVRNFAWRLLPNHGKVYPKEKPIHQTDLDALRNHHDLLCTLYYAVPDGCRPRLAAIINLVDPANSHRETCNISLRAWTRLVRFQLSTKEDVTGLEPFAAWHHHFVTEFIKQHALARREIEAQNTGDNQFSHQVIERTISQNQRQIESLLKTAVNSLENAIQLSPTLDHAYRLVSQSPINALLGLFNPKASRVNATVSEALDMANSYVRKCNSSVVGSANPNPSAPVDEDSQEYGDWTALEAMYEDELAPAAQPLGIDYLEKELHPAVSRLVSNCFGEDHCPEDEILLSVVDCWSSIAQTLVKYGLRHWDGYLSLYNGDSWAALRVTEQTRKFTPKFLASCIEKDVRFISDCRLQVYGMWLSSLMERVSMLKFQHSLTEALLNCEPVNPLLQNLPFIKGQNGRYSLTLEDLCQCRLSLVSCVLSNMREHLQDLEDAASRSLGNTKHEYRELIQKMMTSMKSNYQELGSSATGAQGAYVDFVHRVVGFLQQHTRDICPIDPFFTDPSSFPLPSTDPTYIVARMKGYEPKLSSEKVAKTLIMFVQGISERAAIDGQQVYLVDQLYTSMTNTYEAGDAAKPTLRATLMQCVFPAYLEMAFSNPGAWLLSRPIVQTITLTFKELLFNIDTTDANCVASVMGIFFWVFGSSYKALYSIVENANLLREPAVVITATAFVEMITSTLRVVDYIDRATDAGEKLISQIHALRQVILVSMSFLQDQLPSGIEDITAPAHILADTSTSISTPNFFTEVRLSATRELQTYINESWSRHQDKYYFTRRGGHQPQEIGIEPSVAATLENSPAAIFVETAQDFLNTLNLLDSFDTSI
ncbi:hypothetical protein BDV25DRAFT_159696 [Aspergillus avenaceus]|uniref:Mus7/MMS22 family-domain-containing protein n=1 Tax=Aspergillus avenaceus TaxID=36643 RepID=A0A5N6TN86_ASPAV|nr:hypothetical protein BDV25DRAFT_159696 [Aspergillus avenaceus]